MSQMVCEREVFESDPSRLAASAGFLRLFVPGERRFYAYVLTLLPNRADAEDVLQEASMVMWSKFDEDNPPNDFVAWGCRIAYHKVLDFYKKQQRSKVQFSQPLVEQLAQTALDRAGALQLDERNEALAECIGKLSSRDRELLTRRFSGGDPVSTLSRHFGCSADAIYKSLARIRLALFECARRRLAMENSA
jgi:RNA polymerase sigma-70 factor (ECF subfamily)